MNIIKLKLYNDEQSRWEKEVQRVQVLFFASDLYPQLIIFILNGHVNRWHLTVREETGQYSSELREERWCRICEDRDSIEDTLHFLSACLNFRIRGKKFWTYCNGLRHTLSPMIIWLCAWLLLV